MVSCNDGLSRLDIGDFTGALISVLRVDIGKKIPFWCGEQFFSGRFYWPQAHKETPLPVVEPPTCIVSCT